MTLRVCGEPGCPVLVTPAEGRCAPHRAAAEVRRGRPAARGYGRDFKRAKRDPAYQTATQCVTCTEPFTPDNPKTAGHLVALRNGGQGSLIVPQCRRCNYGWKRTGV